MTISAPSNWSDCSKRFFAMLSNWKLVQKQITKSLFDQTSFFTYLSDAQEEEIRIALILKKLSAKTASAPFTVIVFFHFQVLKMPFYFCVCKIYIIATLCIYPRFSQSICEPTYLVSGTYVRSLLVFISTFHLLCAFLLQLSSSISLSPFSKVHRRQCDQVGRFIALWATFLSLWKQLFFPNSYNFGNFLKVLN